GGGAARPATPATTAPRSRSPARRPPRPRGRPPPPARPRPPARSAPRAAGAARRRPRPSRPRTSGGGRVLGRGGQRTVDRKLMSRPRCARSSPWGRRAPVEPPLLPTAAWTAARASGLMAATWGATSPLPGPLAGGRGGPPRLLTPLNGEETGPVPLTGPASVSSAAQWRSGGSDEELTEGILPVSRAPSGEGPRRPPSKGDGPAPGRPRPGASRSGAGPGRSARGARPESGTAGIGPVSPTAGSGPVSSSAGVGPVSPARAVGPRPAPSFTRGAG